MKHSRYNYIIKKDGEFIIFNSVSGAIISADEPFLEKFLNLRCDQNESDQLFKMGFWVEDNCDELKRLLEKNKDNIANQDTKIYTICPTTYCNARCFYCFENNRKHFVMNESIADAVVQFIRKDVLNSNSKHVCLSWFGGEPLMCQKTMIYITSKLLNDVELAKKVDICAKITTNGILVNDEVIKMFKTLKIDTAQITLDGFGGVYENRKAYVNQENSFERIIKNIKNLCDNQIYVSIRLNYDDNNVDSILTLIEFLNKEFDLEQKQFITAYPAKLENNQCCSVCNHRADKNYINIIQSLINAGIGKTLKQLNLKYRFAHCLIESEYNYVIGANGDLYRCNEVIDNSKFIIGNVFEGVKIPIKPKEINIKCKDCKFFPICQGGCPMRGVDNNDSSSKCQMEKFILEDILKLYI